MRRQHNCCCFTNTAAGTGNSEIGLSTAILFAQEGAKIGITGRNKETLKSAVQAIGNNAFEVVSDVTDLKSITTAYQQIAAQLGKIDVLVVNAGIAPSIPLADFTGQAFNQISDINFKGAFFSIQLALPFLNDGASIILTSSATNEKGFPGNSAYAATKAAVRSLARSFSTDLMNRNIRVNVLSPGAIDTPIWSRGGASQEEINGTKD